MRRFLVGGGFIALLLAAWEVLVRTGVLSPMLFPSPQAVARWIGKNLTDGTLLDSTAVTCVRLALGYGIGVAVGLPLGFLLARSQAARDSIGVLALAVAAAGGTWLLHRRARGDGI